MANFDLVGKEYAPVSFTVEAGKVREFAEAVGDDNPVYYDAEYGKQMGLGGIIAPPIFVRNFWIEGFQVHRDLGFDWARVLYGEQEFEYFRHLRVGEQLTAQLRIADMYQKRGRRGGYMTFAVIETTVHDADDVVVVVARRTLIETQPKDDASDKQQQPGGAFPRRRPSYEEVEEGQESPPLVIGPVTRTDFVRFAGAAGDFNPNHHDEVYAIRSGYDRVFAMGTLSAGYLGRLASDWFGDGRLRRWRIRFREQLWPGDVLSCKAVVTGKRKRVEGGEGLVEADLSAENQHGRVVTSAQAVFSFPLTS